MFDYPRYAVEAFVYTYGEEIEELIEGFVSRWGNLEPETFGRVLHEGQGEEHVLAIFAIGLAPLPFTQVREALVPFLESGERMARWACALCLGWKKEPHALPVLVSMLEEGISPQWSYNEWEWYEGMREDIPQILGEWEDASLVPALRHALHTVCALEPQVARPPSYDWRRFQSMLAWALGRYGCFGALAGLHLRGSRLRLVMMQMAWGHLQVQTSSQDLFTVIVEQKNVSMKQALLTVLAQRFGLSEEEALVCLNLGLDSLTHTEEAEAYL